MGSEIVIKFKKNEKKILKKLISSGKENSRKITRARILLMRNEKKGIGEIADALMVTTNTVRSVCRRYVVEGMESAINEKARPGAPTIFEGKARAQITALACSQPPEGHGKWSLRLLADKAVELDIVDYISHTDVGRILKKTK